MGIPDLDVGSLLIKISQSCFFFVTLRLCKFATCCLCSHSTGAPLVRGSAVAMSAVLAPLAAALLFIDSEAGEIRTDKFLAACRLVLPVFDKLGVAFSAAKSDVRGNIERLEKRRAKHALLFDVCKEEIADDTQGNDVGCCKGLLWLKRFLEFVVALLEGVVSCDVDESGNSASLKTIAQSAYEKTLAPYHGWLASAAFAVVMQFPPTKHSFIRSLDNDHEGMKKVVRGLKPALARVHEFLCENDLNDPAKV